MEYLPFYLGGFGILILGVIGFFWYQNERLKKKLVEEARQSLTDRDPMAEIEQRLTSQGLEKAQAHAIIDLAQKKVHIHTALELLHQGKSEDVVKERLIERGVHADLALEIVGSAQFAKYCQEHPVVSLTLGIVLPLLGVALIIGGVLLWLGNKSGRFVTFPFSGQIAIGIGVLIFTGGAAFFVRVMKG